MLSRVDHHGALLDCDRGFGDVGCQDDFPLAILPGGFALGRGLDRHALEDALLFLGAERAVERDDHAAELVLDLETEGERKEESEQASKQERYTYIYM